MVIAFSGTSIAYGSNIAALSGGQNLDIEQPKVGGAQNTFSQLVAYDNSSGTYIAH